MVRYTVSRLLTGALAVFVLATFTFFLVRLMPGSPFQNGAVSQQVVEAIEEEYGLHEPLFSQYTSYMAGLLHGDFGISYQDPGTRVTEIIARAWPLTASLGVVSLAAAVAAGTGLGIFQAMYRKRTAGRVLSFIGMMMAGVPGFAVALLLLLIFCVRLKWLPSAGLLSPAHYILPVLSLAVYPSAVIARLMGNALAEEEEKEYVRFALAKGLGKRRVLLTHELKNAWFPVLGYIGPAATYLLTGSFVTESIFTIPGLGREFVLSVMNRDYTMILGLTVFMGTVVIAVNLISDLAAAWADPRVRKAYSEKEWQRKKKEENSVRKEDRK